MQIASSASCTCIEFMSASEYTATVRMFSSLQARMIRTAISPRLATRIFSNMGYGALLPQPNGNAGRRDAVKTLNRPNLKQRLPKLDGLGAVHEHLCNDTLHLGLNLVHYLHCFYNADHCIRVHLGA